LEPPICPSLHNLSPQETPSLPLSLLHLRQRLLRLRSRPALSTAVAMSRAMAMTALINKLTSRPFVFFGMFHPSPRERRRQRLTRCGTRLLAAAVPERSRQSRGLGQPPGAASATPLRITRPARFCTALCSSPCCSVFAIRLSCDASPETQ
jgi:hypothetical protein